MRSRRKTLRVLFGAFALTALITVLGWVVWNGVASKRLERALVALRAVGMSTDVPPRNRAPVAVDRNAAPLLVAAHALVTAQGGVDALARELAREPLPDAARATLERLAPAFALASEAAARPECVFDLEVSGGVDAGVSHLTPVRDLAALFLARGRLRAREERAEDALRDLEVVAALGGHLATEPLLVAQALRLWISTSVDDVLRPALEAVDDPVVRWRALRRAALRGAFRIGLRAEVASTVALCQLAEGRGEPGGSRGRGLLRSPLRSVALPYLRSDVARLLDSYARLARLVDVPYSEAVAGAREEGLRIRSGGGFFGLRELPPVYRVLIQEAEAESWRALVGQGALILRWRREHGAYPEKLEELGGEGLLIDPATDRPFGWSVDGPRGRLASEEFDAVSWDLPGELR